MRRSRVQAALEWLSANNPLYADIMLDKAALDSLPEDDIPDSVWDSVVSSADMKGEAKQGSSYVPPPVSDENKALEESEVPMLSSGVIDIDAESVSMLTRAETVRNSFKPEYLRVPHDPEPTNTTRNPNFWLLGFPWLFPWGIGAPDDPDRSFPLSLELFVRRALELQDDRFRCDPAFMFVAANLIQRYHVCLQTKLVMQTASFKRSAEMLRALTSAKVRRPFSHVADCGPFTRLTKLSRPTRSNVRLARSRPLATARCRRCSIK